MNQEWNRLSRRPSNDEVAIKNLSLNKKHLYSAFDIYHRNMFNRGTQFFFFTIVPVQDDTASSVGGEEKDENLVWDAGDQILEILRSLEEIEMIEYGYLSIEYGEQEKHPHYHGLIGIRSLLGYNVNLEASIHEYLQYVHKDIRFEECRRLKDIYKAFNYVVKEHKYRNHFLFSSGSDVFDILHGKMGDYLTSSSLGDLVPVYSNRNHKLWRAIPHLSNDNEHGRRVEPVDMVVFLFGLYLELCEMCTCNGRVYAKDPSSRCTWNYIHDLDFFDKNHKNIVDSLKTRFPMQLGRTNLNEMFVKHIDTATRHIKDHPNLPVCKDVRHDAVEFLDGIYLTNHDVFINFYNSEYLGRIDFGSLRVDRRYPIQYRGIRTPDLWLGYLGRNECFKTKERLEEFCINLGRYLQSELAEDRRDEGLYLVGGSGTGKTSLITNLLTEVARIEDEGTIHNDGKEIPFEGKVGEQDHRPSQRSDLLEYHDNGMVGVNQKHVAHRGLFRNLAPTVFLSNMVPSVFDMIRDPALAKGLIVYMLDHYLRSLDIDEREGLKKEIPRIFVYCNRLFYERAKKGYKRSDKERRKAISDFKALYIGAPAPDRGNRR